MGSTRMGEQIVKLRVLVRSGVGMFARVASHAAVTFLQRIRKNYPILTSIAILLLATCLCWQLHCERSRVAKLELKIYFDSVELGVSEEEAVDIFCEAGFQRIWLHTTEEGLLVRTPLEMGAHNWIAIMCTDKSGLIAAKAVRLHDSLHRKPAAGPEDEVMDNYNLPARLVIESIFVNM